MSPSACPLSQGSARPALPTRRTPVAFAAHSLIHHSARVLLLAATIQPSCMAALALAGWGTGVSCPFPRASQSPPGGAAGAEAEAAAGAENEAVTVAEGAGEARELGETRMVGLDLRRGRASLGVACLARTTMI